MHIPQNESVQIYPAVLLHFSQISVHKFHFVCSKLLFKLNCWLYTWLKIDEEAHASRTNISMYSHIRQKIWCEYWTFGLHQITFQNRIVGHIHDPSLMKERANNDQTSEWFVIWINKYAPNIENFPKLKPLISSWIAFFPSRISVSRNLGYCSPAIKACFLWQTAKLEFSTSDDVFIGWHSCLWEICSKCLFSCAWKEVCFSTRE